MELISPMFFLVLLTFVIGITLGASRLIISIKGDADSEYFKLWKGYTPPDFVQLLERNFLNLFEVPVLFYIAGVIAIVSSSQNTLILVLAWGFVGLRYLHTFIHVTYNNPLHRVIIFIASSVVALAMWVQLMMDFS